MKSVENDLVNHPKHYTQGNIECIDVLVQMSNQGLDYRVINAMKYLWRYKEKNGDQDIEKAVWYLNHFLDEKQKIKKQTFNFMKDKG
jgi:hypothetical protein